MGPIKYIRYEWSSMRIDYCILKLSFCYYFLWSTILIFFEWGYPLSFRLQYLPQYLENTILWYWNFEKLKLWFWKNYKTTYFCPFYYILEIAFLETHESFTKHRKTFYPTIFLYKLALYTIKNNHTLFWE